jgi:hypothetical protein
VTVTTTQPFERSTITLAMTGGSAFVYSHVERIS